MTGGCISLRSIATVCFANLETNLDTLLHFRRDPHPRIPGHALDDLQRSQDTDVKVFVQIRNEGTLIHSPNGEFKLTANNFPVKVNLAKFSSDRTWTFDTSISQATWTQD